MPTPKKGPRLGGSATNQKHILSNLAGQLITHGAIKTTDAKAKLLRPYVEKLITKAKRGTLSDRRNVLKKVPQKDIVARLFNELAPKFENRDGGYTRIVKLENRKGDNAPMSQISLVLEETVSAEASRAGCCFPAGREACRGCRSGRAVSRQANVTKPAPHRTAVARVFRCHGGAASSVGGHWLASYGGVHWRSKGLFPHWRVSAPG